MILDTNAITSFAEGNLSAREKIATGPGPHLPVIVIGEYRFGLLEGRDRPRRLAWSEQLTRHGRCLKSPWTPLPLTPKSGKP